MNGAPQLLFSGPFDFSQGSNWSPSPDGTFIMVKADPTTGRQLRVVFNWFEELKTIGHHAQCPAFILASSSANQFSTSTTLPPPASPGSVIIRKWRSSGATSSCCRFRAER